MKVNLFLSLLKLIYLFGLKHTASIATHHIRTMAVFCSIPNRTNAVLQFYSQIEQTNISNFSTILFWYWEFFPWKTHQHLISFGFEIFLCRKAGKNPIYFKPSDEKRAEKCGYEIRLYTNTRSKPIDVWTDTTELLPKRRTKSGIPANIFPIQNWFELCRISIAEWSNGLRKKNCLFELEFCFYSANSGKLTFRGRCAYDLWKKTT